MLNLTNIPLYLSHRRITKENIYNPVELVIDYKVRDIAEYIKFIYSLTSIISKIQKVKVRVVDLLELFKEPILDIKLFSDNFNAVFDALEKDCLTRTESQDFGVNIIIGAGQYKQKLNAEGQEKFRNIFANIQNSKQTTYILVDNYENQDYLKMFEFVIKECL